MRQRIHLSALLIAATAVAGQNARSSEGSKGPVLSGGAGVSSSGDSTSLEVVDSVMVGYPLSAVKTKQQGLVIVEVGVSETGDVVRENIASGDPDLAKAALDAVKHWKFKPFIKNGQAVRVSTKLAFDFIYRDEESLKKARPIPADPSSFGSGPAMKIVWLSGALLQKLKAHEVFPIYPPIAKGARIQGAVELFALIGKDGKMRQIQVLTGDPLLRDAAVDAAKQWRYRPYIFDGEPVPVQSLITINFTMSGG